MIYDLLIGYSITITLVVAISVWSSRKTNTTQEVNQSSSMVARIIEEEFGKRGISAKVHELPKTPTEAVVVYSTQILKAIKEAENVSMAWISWLREREDKNVRDVEALMTATQAILKNLMDKKPFVSEVVPGKNREQFAAYFEYVRDHFPVTVPEKKVINSIINNLKSDAYGERQ